VNVDHRLLVLEGNVRQAAAVGRPRRRDDRFPRDQRHLRILAVGIGDVQLVARRAGADDVGDAGGEDTRLAGQFLVDDVGDAMSGCPQHRLRGHEGRATERRLLVDVVEAKARFLPTIVARADAAGSQRIGAAALPVAECRTRRLGQGDAAAVDHPEQAASFQVGTNDRSDDARRSRVATKLGNRHRDAVGAGAGDLDRQLAMRRCQQQGEGSESQQAEKTQLDCKSRHGAVHHRRRDYIVYGCS
jgi:hypothetical protein